MRLTNGMFLCDVSLVNIIKSSKNDLYSLPPYFLYQDYSYVNSFLFQAGLTPCLQERISSEGYTGSTLPGRFSPDCDRDGNYKPLQCQVSSGVCWCVDSQGQEIPGTRGREKRPCPAPGKITMTLRNILGVHAYDNTRPLIVARELSS